MVLQMRVGGLELTIFFLQEQNPVTLPNDRPASQILVAEQASSAADASSVASHSVGEMIQNNSDTVLSEAFTTASTTIAKAPETALLDERSLLACIVRTIPAAGRIRISSTVSICCFKCESSSFL
jgi:hypothetical protein